MSYLIEDIESSLIKCIEYDPDSRELRIGFRKYFVDEFVYVDVPFNYFEEFANPTGKSHGQFYLQMIKPKFKIKQKPTNMANSEAPAKKRPVTVNYEQGTQKRYIRMSIDVTKINKALLVQSDKGNVYLQVTLQMLPEGKMDKYNNLGMITQDVPNEIFQKEKHLPVAQRTQGVILGNGAEFERKVPDGTPGDVQGTLLSPDNEEVKDVLDDLPF